MDTTKMVLMVAMVVVAAALVRTSSGQQAQQPPCFGQLEMGCNDTDTDAGITKCCQTVDSVYRTDASCLCEAFKAINYTRVEAVNFFTFCNVTSSNGTPYPCESTPLGGGYSQTVAPISGPEPPSFAPSPDPY